MKRLHATTREARGLIEADALDPAVTGIRNNLCTASLSARGTVAEKRAFAAIGGAVRAVDVARTSTGYASLRDVCINRARAPEIAPPFYQRSYTNHAGTRDYKLFLPSVYHGQPLPLIIMLHGCNQTADDFAVGTRMNVLAEARGCCVAYPMQPPSANWLKCWHWFCHSDQQRGQGEPSIIAGLTREVVRSYGLDRNRVYVAGLSAGGAMAVILGRTYPDLFAAVGVHSGLPYGIAHDLPSAFAAMNRGSAIDAGCPQEGGLQPPFALPAIPTIVFHGYRDTTVHPSNGKEVAAQSAAGSVCSVRDRAIAAVAISESHTGRVSGGRTYDRTVYTDASGQVVVEQWLVHGAGHAWFGGDHRGSYTDPEGPDASSEMTRFFYDHALKVIP